MSNVAPTLSPVGMNNETTDRPSAWVLDLTWDDANWILTASFIIFTMQTGFGMLESGCVSVKNEANIMMKNVVDVVFGGFTYWLFGFSMSFGNQVGSTSYFGVGEYAVDSDYEIMGPVFASFMFQLSFATTATTIVSGTMAERCNFKSYCLFSMLNTVVYCVPARWIWGPTGFLVTNWGVIDIAGSGAVHLLGGVSGYVAAWMLGPRIGRYDNGPASLPLGNPTNCIVGLFILWWGWLAFNSGSTFGISGNKWKFAARAATSTTIASFGGGLVGTAWTLLVRPGRVFQVMDIVNPILGALVAVTAGCALYHTTDGFIVGCLGGLVVQVTAGFADYTRVDDPVGATAVHAFGGLVGLLCVGLFAEEDRGEGWTKGNAGIFRGGSFYLLKVQSLAAVYISVWAACVTFILLYITNKLIPIRMEPHEELLGADFVEHLVRRKNAGISPALSIVGSHPDIQRVVDEAALIGQSNPIHDILLVGTGQETKSARWIRLKTKAAALSFFTGGCAKMKLSSSKVTSTSEVEGVKPDLLFRDEAVFITEFDPKNKKVRFNYLDYLGRVPYSVAYAGDGHRERSRFGSTESFYYSNETSSSASAIDHHPHGIRRPLGRSNNPPIKLKQKNEDNDRF